MSYKKVLNEKRRSGIERENEGTRGALESALVGGNLNDKENQKMRRWKISEEARAKAFEQGTTLLQSSNISFIGEMKHPATRSEANTNIRKKEYFAERLAKQLEFVINRKMEGR